MEINGINQALAGNTQSTQNTNGQLGKNEFLQLLVAQLQNQDPINPMDGTEFATQLAQFNSVEQLINMNEGIAELSRAQDIMSNGLTNSLASSLAGKTVKVLSNQIAVGESGKSEISFRLNQLASDAEIIVRDANGTVIRTDKMENLSPGDHIWEWNGKTDDGNRVPEGVYTVEVKAKNGDSNISALTFMEGQVEKVRFTGEGVKLLVNGVLISLGNVEEIGV
ncbi:MAG: flagellar hook assembly protein FlgD [Balneolaceae bacterium]